MFVYLGAALLLLVVMAWFVLSPFLVPATATRAAARPPVVTPPRSVARTATAPAAAAAATRPAAPIAPAATVPADDDLHARVEAAIAARKAAMVRHSCDGCGASVDPGDAFCRACGTRV